MSDPKRHHYVSQFLLEGWCGDDGRLCVYTRKGGRLVFDRHTPKHTAYEIVKRLRTVDQDRRRRVDHPLGCDDAAPRLEARSEA